MDCKCRKHGMFRHYRGEVWELRILVAYHDDINDYIAWWHGAV